MPSLVAALDMKPGEKWLYWGNAGAPEAMGVLELSSGFERRAPSGLPHHVQVDVGQDTMADRFGVFG